MRKQYDVANSRPQLSRRVNGNQAHGKPSHHKLTATKLTGGKPANLKPVWSHQSYLSSNIGKGIVINIANQAYELSGVLQEVDNFSVLIQDLSGNKLVIFKSSIESFHFKTELAE